MKISAEFSKYAKEYGCYNIIQEKVIQKLLSQLKIHPQNILDLGCGSGGLIKSINWKYKRFLGVDFAEGMLDLHPKSDSVSCIYGNFNDKKLFESLHTYDFEHVFSASALQWAENLEDVFTSIESLKTSISLAIFTSGTFATLHATADIKSLLLDATTIEELANKYFNAYIEVVQYRLEFDSVREMFRYIKKSGVSAGRNVLNYKQTKSLMKQYPLKYLEFEVVFITSR